MAPLLARLKAVFTHSPPPPPTPTPTTTVTPPTPLMESAPPIVVDTPAFDTNEVVVVFVLGGPGAGKGTQCARLVADFGFIHLSAGDLLRAEQARPGSAFGTLIKDHIKEGKIVPMEVTIKLLENAMRAAISTAPSKPSLFLVDGFPRQMDQAVKFDQSVCPSSMVLFLTCPEHVLLERLLERGKTSGRDDDNAESIMKRFRTFIETSMPVVDYYDAQGKVVKIDSSQSIDEVHAVITKALELILPNYAVACVACSSGPCSADGLRGPARSRPPPPLVPRVRVPCSISDSSFLLRACQQEQQDLSLSALSTPAKSPNMPPSTFNDKTTAEEAAAYYASSIAGKVVLVTGVSQGGLGGEAARVIAKNGAALVILAGRSKAKLDETSAVILAETPSASLRHLLVDLASLESVRAAAEEVNKYSESIDVLINNAAVMASPYSTTVDGFENQFGTNHLGPFLLTNLIRPKLVKNVRVVNVSSWGHNLSPILFEDVGFGNGATYDKWKAYGQAKTANMLFSVALQKRWEGVEAFSLHPGAIWTNLVRHLSIDDQKAMGFLNEKGERFSAKWSWKTIPEGTSTHIVAAFDQDIKAQAGSYLVDAQIATEQIASYALDEANAAKLWTLSEEMVGQKFPRVKTGGSL